MRLFLLFTVLFFTSQFSYSQREVGSYVHHAEIGALLGTSNEGERVNFSLQSFHGVQIDKLNTIGFFVGFDTYPDFSLMPIGFGWKHTITPEKKYSLYSSLDLGYGSAWFQKKETENGFQSWDEGGFMASPAIGLRKKDKSGNDKYSFAIGFKKQYARSYEGRLSSGISATVEGIPPGFDSLFEEKFVFNNLFIRVGMIF
ncbi:hypothetical protein MM236_13155 [Belliella sp. DSM 107340]|uniref:Outer membrane protein beta-barrel domain-containing protein n=1 Tax=Belliella calami TaxID=2923436 RepID=A0ABS9UQQ4_9BACT|nr:hypothetical protein [Belliella calami]MCH7398947.1 hypothetical protein [Belliella calami]